ncbi:phosphoserine transaminase [Entamoeba marina]
MRTTAVHNFNPGPAALSNDVIEETTKACANFSKGMSILEISHRSKEWINVMDETGSLLKEILNIPEGYSTLFLGAGASMQFLQVAYNFLNTKAAYLDTGAWSSKAIKEAQYIGETVVVASSKDKNYCYIPEYTIPTDCDYFHITTNNTIYGTEIKEDIDSPIPLIADMSSDILSRPVDISKYSLVYAGAQKNCGAAGVAVIIVKDSLLETIKKTIPSMLDYRLHAKNNSMYNTPPVISIFTVNQTLKHIKKIGGLKEIQKLNQEKARILYEEIDRNQLFKGTAEKSSRSLMNITFVMEDKYKDLETEFTTFVGTKGIIGLKGHRSVGGFRASCYNAVELESVKHLVEVMQEFEKQHL